MEGTAGNPIDANRVVEDMPDMPDVPLSAAMADTFGDLLDAVAASDRVLASVSAARAELIDQARQWSELSHAATPTTGGWDAATTARRVLVTELACALRLPERTVENLVEQSRSLLHELPATLESLRAGRITYRHAQSMIDHADSLPEEARGPFEQLALPFAQRLTVAQFDRRARVLRERAHPETIDARQEKCATDRSVTVQPARDGMAWLSAYLPAVDAHGIYARITDIALGLHTADEARTLTQLRTDAFADLLIDGVTSAGVGHDIRARVLVTVPALTLLGLNSEPATLDGYGPIDTDTARRLAAHAPSFIRILTHPETGAVLSVGRDRYAVPSDLRTWLGVRDETCRYPGCSRNSRWCDIDHTTDWQYGGTTSHTNLAHLCPGHHHLKHQTEWKVKQAGNGTLQWTSPSGRLYNTEPANMFESAPAP
ncbi:DUF222 domain-containing protein [Glaciihabitans sp. UYNi722]|uniref:HNH endonuclease signature motif containing protein n=1 Tax=Glaciihabitans sp. UYNi722 TaxID=3156344 RepID=UPI0033956230